MAKLGENGMFPDGTNPEAVDPVPALEWNGPESFKDVVVHGMRMSPAVSKILCFLRYYKIQYTLKPSLGKKGSKYYKKMPVLDVAGRQVNDSYIIVKNLSTALTGQYDEDWEHRITYHYMLSARYANASDVNLMKKVMRDPHNDFPAPKCIVPCIVGHFSRSGNKALEKMFQDPGNPATKVDITEFCKEFAQAVGDKAFFGGDEPGQVDISLYGTSAQWIYLELPPIMDAFHNAGLSGWLARMKELIPLNDSPKAIFMKL